MNERITEEWENEFHLSKKSEGSALWAFPPFLGVDIYTSEKEVLLHLHSCREILKRPKHAEGQHLSKFWS